MLPSNIPKDTIMKKLHLSLALILILTSVLTACAPQAPSKSKPVQLKIAVLPIVDSLPLYVAEKEKLFNKHNIEVVFVPVASSAERDQLIAAGQADGMINELVSTMMFNKESVQVQIVRYAFRPALNSPHFYILASAKSGITTPAQLKGVEIGVSQGTLIEYVTDRLLEANGLTLDDIKTVSIPKMSDRSALLASGEIKAAVMPDPLATLAIKQGAKVVLDDSDYPQYGFSVISFRKDMIDNHPGAIRSFLTSIEEATQLINANPARFGTLLSDKKVVPESLKNSYKVPTFPLADVPSKDEWKDTLDWARGKDLLGDQTFSYSDTIIPNYLPK
jgi:NitT/TauT family transport system substrate-binding protein